MNKIAKIYDQLILEYGPQGWWPLLDLGDPKYKPGDKNYGGYHPKDYTFPRTEDQIFEISIGAILTQNTAWNNVIRALVNLKKLNVINPKKILDLDENKLKEYIKPAGYFNQKAKKLRTFSEFFIKLKETPTREQLLDIWGVGEETADSMLLYAFKVPTFVVDAYTRRIFANLGLIDKDAKYAGIKALFENNLEPDLILYQEYHALIVEHAKRYYSGRKDSYECPLSELF